MTGIMYLSHPGTFGYAEAAKRYIIGLARAGVPVTWVPVVHINAEGTKFDLFKGLCTGDRELDPFCNRQISYDTVIVHVLPRAVPDCLKRVSAKKMVGYVAWDTGRLPDGWAKLYGAFDLLLVPCSWNQTVFERGGLRIPARVVPHLFSGTTATERSPTSCAAQDEFVFYTIGSWTQRKGTADVVDAYLKAFTDSDNVKLIVKTDAARVSGGSWLRASLRRVLKQGKRRLNLLSAEEISPAEKVTTFLSNHQHAPKIELVTDDVPKEEIIRIHKQGNCFVSLTKGEAWGLGAFDAAGYGNPVIITGIGGPLDYLDTNSAYLLDYHLKMIHDRSVKEWFGQEHFWAVPDQEQAVQTMRHVFTHRHEAFKKGQMLSNRIFENFNEPVVIRCLLKALGR
jgi:glycosyltransferase involved in cell wall biosynthesis